MKTKTTIIIAIGLIANFTLQNNLFAQKIAAGDGQSLSICSNGTVMAWGLNGNGQLGDGTLVDKPYPVQVSGLTGIIAIAAGTEFSLALKNDGTLWSWGINDFGQLGNGSVASNSSTPVQVSGLSGITAIACGKNHSLAIKSDSTVWVWGQNTFNQLGNGNTVSSNIPIQVNGLTSIIAVAAGESHSLVLKNDGTAWGWGLNLGGQLADGTTTQRATPVQSWSSLTGIIAFSCGKNHSLALRNDGTVWGCGLNHLGQLGNGVMNTTGCLCEVAPVQAIGLSQITSIEAGRFYSLARKNDSTAWIWGENANGQLGDSTIISNATPNEVSRISGVLYVTGGRDYTVALKSDQTVWSWGQNANGQLGDSTTIQRISPILISGVCPVTITGTREIQEQFNVNINPNPNQGLFNVDLPQNSKNLKLLIFNLLGEVVYNVQLVGISNKVNVSQLPAGLYVIKISDENHLITRKFIKQ